MTTMQLIEGSRNVYSAGYDAAQQVLSVRFWRGYGSNRTPGAVRYDYANCDQERADGFFSAESKSKYLDSHIKPNCEFQKVEIGEDE